MKMLGVEAEVARQLIVRVELMSLYLLLLWAGCYCCGCCCYPCYASWRSEAGRKVEIGVRRRRWVRGCWGGCGSGMRRSRWGGGGGHWFLERDVQGRGFVVAWVVSGRRLGRTCSHAANRRWRRPAGSRRRWVWGIWVVCLSGECDAGDEGIVVGVGTVVAIVVGVAGVNDVVVVALEV